MEGGVATGERVHSVLASTFGFDSFRPLQQEIVDALLKHRDVFALLPTGGGKSLCYQLPAQVMDGTAVVVSPLIALMKDQVDALRVLGVQATFINSSLGAEEIARREQMVLRGEVKLLYVAPERLMFPRFLHLLDGVRLSLIAIDEAHCISEWGHDFRPEYRELRRLRDLFPGVPVGAFTATATGRVQADIVAHLGLQHAARFRGSFNRRNLIYEVRPKRDAYDEVVAYLRAHPRASGIIYCRSRAETERVAGALRADGVRAAAYHAGLSAEERRVRQEAFIRDDVPVMVATIAFGMGIDKPDVRFVIHYDLPRTLENYYQESGRAGRDGEAADCILFFSGSDVMRLRRFAEEKGTPGERAIALAQLRRMAEWAETERCRRQALLAYFDERLTEPQDPCCDNCRLPVSQEDITVPAQMLLSCIKRTGERYGATHIIDVLRGSQAKKVLDARHDRLSTYGIGRGRSRESWQAVVREMIHAGYIVQEEERFNALRVTERARAVLFDGERVTMTVRRPVEVRAPSTDDVHAELFQRLRTLRKGLADDVDVAPYVIAPDTTLRRMAAGLPADRGELLRIPGMGEHRVDTYGDAFLGVIAAYVAETGATPVEPPPAPRTTGRNPSSVQTLALFREGKTPEEIAQTRGLAASTVETHLAGLLESGEEIDLDRLVPPEKQRAIRAAIAVVGADLLAPIMEHLGEGFTYGELRLVRAGMRGAERG